MKYPWIIRDGATGREIAAIDGMDAATEKMRELGADGFAESGDGGRLYGYRSFEEMLADSEGRSPLFYAERKVGSCC